MKVLSLFAYSLFSLTLVTAMNAQANEDTRLFELRVYHPNEGKLDALLTRFRDHTLALFDTHGIENIGYWVPLEGDPQLVYLVAFPDRQARDRAWEEFVADPDWKKAYEHSIADGSLVDRIDSVFLNVTGYSPALALEERDPARLFEMRTYKASEGNLGALDARFADHTIGLFDKFGIDNIVYFHFEDGQEGAGSTLLYLIAHDGLEAREKSFDAFRNSEEWKIARAQSEERAGGSLTVPKGVTHQFLVPTDFSMLK